MAREIKKVRIKYGTNETLAKMFGVSVRTVGNATSGTVNTELCRAIRKKAVELGGDAIYGCKKLV